MGAVRLRVQTADKNNTNPHQSSLSINILCSEKLQFCKKQIHQDISNKSTVYNIVFFSEHIV